MSGRELNISAIAPESKGSVPADESNLQWLNAGVLAEWLGSFWTEVSRSDELVSSLQQTRALRIAQLYLDLLEALELKDRSGAPVFHRERWHPIVLRESMRNTGSPEMLKLGVDHLQLGRQGETEGFPNPYLPDGMKAYLGSTKVSIPGMVVYPLFGASAGLKSSATCVVNSIAGATVFLGSGRGFQILDGAVAIDEDEDPFTGAHADEFPKFEVDAGEAFDPEDDKWTPDRETVLWVCDAMFDRDYVDRHLAYALGLHGTSSETCKRVVNAAWNAVASGCTPLVLKSLMACICGLPTVKTDDETVESVYTDGGPVVVTDRNVYRLPEGSVLKKGVVAGAVLRRFDTLDTSVRIYPFVNEPGEIGLWSEFCESVDDFRGDFPAMDLPPALFRTGVEEGFSVGWEPAAVYCAGLDANGNPKLWFYLDGLEEDNAVFWEGVWAGCEASGTSLEKVMGCSGMDSGGEAVEPGVSCGTVVPIEFFLRNLVGANTLIITVRTDTIPVDAPLYDPGFFGVLRDCVPKYVRLCVVEHASAPEEEVDLDGDGSSVADSAEAYVEAGAEDEVDAMDGMDDSVSARWVARCAAGR